ncbi:MAG TPA: hypothetical protein VK177_02920 [Flavobacteriales bacterium]|nr:hypothetical protein [Flavobacteriales bacterium]
MKKLVLSIFAAATLVACGGGNDPAADAQATCDCNIKANTMKADDPNRSAEQKKCMDMSMDMYKKYKDDIEGMKTFNEKLMECSKEVMEKSMESYK